MQLEFGSYIICSLYSAAKLVKKNYLEQFLPQKLTKTFAESLLLHALQAFPTDIPRAILGESGIEGFLTTIPTCTHHSDGGQ